MSAQRPDLQELYDALGTVINRWRESWPEDLTFVAGLLSRRALTAQMVIDATGEPPLDNVQVAGGDTFPE